MTTTLPSSVPATHTSDGRRMLALTTAGSLSFSQNSWTSSWGSSRPWTRRLWSGSSSTPSSMIPPALLAKAE